ncbi:MAG: phasin family protein [Pseudomonadota bacterium]
MAETGARKNGGTKTAAKPKVTEKAAKAVVAETETLIDPELAHTVEDMAHTVDEMAQNAVAAGETMASSGIGIYRDGLHFMADRVMQDIAFHEKLLDCKSPTEVYEVQAAYLQSTAQQYSTHCQRMVTAMMDAVSKVGTADRRPI